VAPQNKRTKLRSHLLILLLCKTLSTIQNGKRVREIQTEDEMETGKKTTEAKAQQHLPRGMTITACVGISFHF